MFSINNPVASYGVLEKLELAQIFTRLTLITNVSFNNLPASAFTDSCDVVAIRPNLSSPQRPLDTRLTPKNLSRSDAFEQSHYLTRRNLRMRRTQQMDVISVTPNLLKLTTYRSLISPAVSTMIRSTSSSRKDRRYFTGNTTW